jgi:phosphoadenosine phosphosulfate reductase
MIAFTSTSNRVWTPYELALQGATLSRARPEEVLRWGFRHFAPGIALATGFGPEGVVLMHMVSRLRPDTTVFYLDTGLLFPETYALRDRLAERLRLRFTRVSTELTLEEQEERHGPELWAREPDRCCRLRKVDPLRRFLRTQGAWITGIRRDQTAHRASAGVVEWDRANGLVKLNPLAAWSQEEVWTYLHLFELPTNPLHERGFPSIGCHPCTRAVAPGADPRSGRWQGLGKTECGIHLVARGA